MSEDWLLGLRCTFRPLYQRDTDPKQSACSTHTYEQDVKQVLVGAEMQCNAACECQRQGRTLQCVQCGAGPGTTCDATTQPGALPPSHIGTRKGREKERKGEYSIHNTHTQHDMETDTNDSNGTHRQRRHRWRAETRS